MPLSVRLIEACLKCKGCTLINCIFNPALAALKKKSTSNQSVGKWYEVNMEVAHETF